MSKNSRKITESNQPRIGITMRFDEKGDFYLRREYGEAIEGLGGIPFYLPLIPKREFINKVLATLDGLLLPGSDSDVDPLHYGEQPSSKLGKVQPLRDEMDLLLIATALEMGMPILGICYGMQALNVVRGGSLVQDIATQVQPSLQHQQSGARERRSHHIFFESNSLLRTLSGADKTIVNSHHHQSVKTLGQNLRVTARAADNIIEAIEDARDNRFVVGVQWHPELDWSNDNFSQRIFETFISAANRFK